MENDDAEFAALVRETVNRLDFADERLASPAVATLRKALAARGHGPGCHVGRKDLAAMSAECVEWYAGQLLCVGARQRPRVGRRARASRGVTRLAALRSARASAWRRQRDDNRRGGGVMGETTRKHGPAANPPRDGDKRQARQRINVEVRTGKRPHPNTLPCVDCGHVHADGERRHEYDHHRGYAAEHHYDVAPVCTECHAKRDGFAARTHCKHGHEFTAENTYELPSRKHRFCRTCTRERDKRRSKRRWQAELQRRAA